MRWFLCLLLLPAALCAMNGAAEIGVGAKSKGMGGVGVALPQDSFAAAHNPAGTVWLCNRGDIGLGYTFQSADVFTYTISTGLVEPELSGRSTRGLWFPELGVIWHPHKCHALGLMGFVVGAMQVHYPRDLFNLGDSTPLILEAYTVFFTPSWSWRFSPGQSIGLAVNIAFQTFSSNVNTGGANSSAFWNRQNQSFVADGEFDGTAGASLRFGWLGHFFHRLQVGLSYQTKSWSGKLSTYKGWIPNAGDLKWPAQVAAGFSWTFCHNWVVAFDYLCTFWQDVKGWGNTNFALNPRQGSPQGPGFGWRDRSVVKVGTAWTPWRCCTLRLGYNYGPTPIKSREVFRNQATMQVVEHHITLGATACLGCGEFTGYYYHGFKKSVKGSAPYDVSSIYTANLSNSQNGFGFEYGARF